MKSVPHHTNEKRLFVMCLYVRAVTTEETEQSPSGAYSYDAVMRRRTRSSTSPFSGGLCLPATVVGVTLIPRRKSTGRTHPCSPAQQYALIDLLHQRPDTFGHAQSLTSFSFTAFFGSRSCQSGNSNTDGGVTKNTVINSVMPVYTPIARWSRGRSNRITNR